MKKVFSLKEAMKFFLSNSEGNCICVKDGKEQEVESYPEAEDFFNS